MRWLTCVLAAVFLMNAAEAEGPRGALKVDGYVSAGAYDDKGIWFTLTFVDQRFVVDPHNVPNPDAFWNAVLAANKDNLLLTVWFDPETAVIERKTMKPSYVVRTVVYGGQTIAGDILAEPRDARTISSSQDKAEFALARGLAYYHAGQTTKALPLLGQALDFNLAPELKILGLKARSSALEDDILAREKPGNARDRGLYAALQDARAWRKAAPDNADAAINEAWLLSMLGGYDDALAVYADASKRWPDENWRTYRGIGAVYRRMGRLQESLDWIDKLGALPDMKNTMPYRYHRGWTLDEMGRYDEAIAEYTEGMKAQPDYDGAFWRRSCAYAATGQLELALYDIRTARKLRDGFMAEMPVTPASSFDNARYAEVEQTLANAVAKDAHQKITGLCKGYWEWGEGARSRSIFLPAPA